MEPPSVAYSHMLSGKRLLIVESGYFLCEETRRKLLELRAVIVGPVADVDRAMDVIEAGDADAAILDLNLAADLAFPLVEALEQRRLGCVFAIAEKPISAGSSFAGFVLCERGDNIEEIAKALFSPRNTDA